MKLPYQEGNWFAVPLKRGGYAMGVVARSGKKGKIILCYFFGPRRTSIPDMESLSTLSSRDALRALVIGDLNLIRKKWPVIGRSATWTREQWPMPPFLRRDLLSSRAWRVYYSDSEPGVVLREEPDSCDNTSLEEDGLWGAGAVEMELDELLP